MAAKVTERLTGQWRPQANFGDERLRLVAGSDIGVIGALRRRGHIRSRAKPLRPSMRHRVDCALRGFQRPRPGFW